MSNSRRISYSEFGAGWLVAWAFVVLLNKLVFQKWDGLGRLFEPLFPFINIGPIDLVGFNRTAGESPWTSGLVLRLWDILWDERIGNFAIVDLPLILIVASGIAMVVMKVNQLKYVPVAKGFALVTALYVVFIINSAFGWEASIILAAVLPAIGLALVVGGVVASDPMPATRLGFVSDVSASDAQFKLTEEVILSDESAPKNQDGGSPMPPPGNSGPVWGASGDATPAFYVKAYGVGDSLVSLEALRQMAVGRVIQPNTMIQHKDSSFPVPANTVPGVFSDKSFTTALLLSVFLGGIGIDRFYLGFTGLGVLKLLTLGGCGVWALIDLVLIAVRKLPDSDGRPLS